MGERRPCVVIVGAGFGGLFAAKGLRHAEVDILLLDKNNYHTFIPLLYQVAAAELEAEQIAYPVRTLARRQKNLRFVMTNVTEIDLDAQQVITENGAHAYDYLIISAGSVTNFFGMESVSRHAFGIKDVTESVVLRNHILERFEIASHTTDAEERRAQLTFVVVGGGPTGVEFSATLSELISGVLAKDFPELDFNEVQVVLLEAADRLLPSLQPSLSQYAKQVLERKGVEVMLGATVTDATSSKVELKSGASIAAHTLVWTAGVKAAELAGKTDSPQGRGGRLIVTDQLHLPDKPNVFAIGDIAYVEDHGKPVPQVAPAAIQQAEVAAKNILAHITGKPMERFQYKDKGTMVTIGRSSGVAVTNRFQLKGFIAWMAWLAVHLVRIIGFRNRLYVLSNWAWSYIFQDRVRLIIKPERFQASETPVPEQSGSLPEKS